MSTLNKYQLQTIYAACVLMRHEGATFAVCGEYADGPDGVVEALRESLDRPGTCVDVMLHDESVRVARVYTAGELAGDPVAAVAALSALREHFLQFPGA